MTFAVITLVGRGLSSFFLVSGEQVWCLELVSDDLGSGSLEVEVRD